MPHKSVTRLVPGLLVVGSVFGMAGTFVSSSSVRGLAWGIDGVALVLAFALLAVHFVCSRQLLVGTGFLVFLTGQTLVLSTAPMSLSAGAPMLGAGTALWAAALVVISAARYAPLLVRILGFLAAVLLTGTAGQIFAGVPLDAKSSPLPFFAYPVLVATLLGWAWTLFKAENTGRLPTS